MPRDEQRRDRVMQLLGLAFGLMVAVPAAGTSADAVDRADLTQTVVTELSAEELDERLFDVVVRGIAPGHDGRPAVDSE